MQNRRGDLTEHDLTELDLTEHSCDDDALTCMASPCHQRCALLRRQSEAQSYSN